MKEISQGVIGRVKGTKGGGETSRDQREEEVITALRLKGQGKAIGWLELWRRNGLARAKTEPCRKGAGKKTAQSFLLPSHLLSLFPIGQIQPEARGQSNQEIPMVEASLQDTGGTKDEYSGGKGNGQ